MESTRGNYFCTNARNKQLVALRRITMQDIVDGVRLRNTNGRIVQAIYGALNTPPQNRQNPADVELVTKDAYLANMIVVAEGAYKPLLFQLQLAKTDQANQSPPSDDREHFAGDEFVSADDPYD